jgi:type I restriction enzyme S subunit
MDFDARETRKYQLVPGDLLVCEGGEPGRTAAWRDQFPGALFQKALHRVRFPDGAVEPMLFAYFMEWAARSGRLRSHLTGSTIKHLPRETFLTVSIAVPPIREQRRIVAAIEEHLSRLDAAVAGIRRVHALIVRYRAAVLSSACEGRLVGTEAVAARKDARAYESGAELVRRLAEVSSPTTELRLPEGWGAARLREIAVLKGGLTKGQRRRAGTQVRRVPYLRVANVQRGFLNLTDIRDIEATETEIAELALQDGDVLFNEGGDRDKLGRGWVWRAQLPVCVHQNHVFRARPHPGLIDSRLLSWYGNSLGQAYFAREGSQTTNLASLNLTKLGDLPVPVPPAAEQRRIVDEVERCLSVADAFTRATDSAIARAARLRQSILKRAFEGKLVPQEPSDEPAIVLLERIRAARSSTAVMPKKVGRPA